MSGPRFLDAALEAYDAGICVMPPSEDGLKLPLGNGERWKTFQTKRPTREQVIRWYRDEHRTGLGHLCGPISGNAEMFECESLSVYEAFKERGAQVGLGDVIERIEAGWSDLTPGGGIHGNYRCAEISGNVRLARRPKRPDEMRHERDKVAVKIETRGEGGFSVDGPSNGKVHPTGRPYVRHRGGPATMATITPEERRDLFALARTFDEMPREGADHQDAKEQTPAGARPGDDFNARATWEDVLKPHGFRFLFDRGGEGYYRRPGKNQGISATTNYDGSGLLYVFSTSTPFDAERGYSKFSAYAVLNHEKDFKAAAKALAAEGYGTKRETESAANDDAANESPRRDRSRTQAHARSEPAPERIDVPAFPVDVFPEQIRAYVEDGAKALGCSVDLVAIPFFAYVSAILGNAFEIAIKRSFVQRPILWMVVVAHSGKLKTPADTVARKPIVTLQTRAAKAYEAAQKDYKRAMREWKRLPEDRQGDEPNKPLLTHYFTTDATFEALGPILQRSHGLVICRDEILGLVKSCDAYRGGKGGDRQKYLESWDAKPIKIDRRTQEPLFIERPTLSLTGGIQPAVLAQLSDEANLHDGFIPRFLWTYPDTPTPEWSWDDVDDSGAEDLADLLEGLRTSVPKDDCIRVDLHPAAREVWQGWINDNTQIGVAASGLASAVAAKLPAQVARLALILHCLWNSDDPKRMVSAQRLSDAIELGEYFRAHARRVLLHFGASTTPQTAGLSGRVFRALQRAGDWISRTDLHRKLGGNVGGEELTGALGVLEANGLAQCQTDPTATKPRELWNLFDQEIQPTIDYEASDGEWEDFTV